MPLGLESTGILPSVVTAPLSAGARNKHELYRTVASVSSKALLIDSSKHYLEAVSLYRAAPQRTKILLLVRDGRAVLYSGLKRGKARQAAGLIGRGARVYFIVPSILDFERRYLEQERKSLWSLDDLL